MGLPIPSFTDGDGSHRVGYGRLLQDVKCRTESAKKFGLGLPTWKPALLRLSGLQHEAQSLKSRKPNFADGMVGARTRG
jgi:hypothetical protein